MAAYTQPHVFKMRTAGSPVIVRALPKNSWRLIGSSTATSRQRVQGCTRVSQPTAVKHRSPKPGNRQHCPTRGSHRRSPRHDRSGCQHCPTRGSLRRSPRHGSRQRCPTLGISALRFPFRCRRAREFAHRARPREGFPWPRLQRGCLSSPLRPRSQTTYQVQRERIFSSTTFPGPGVFFGHPCSTLRRSRFIVFPVYFRHYPLLPEVADAVSNGKLHSRSTTHVAPLTHPVKTPY